MYDSGIDDHEVFDNDDIVDENKTTMCRTLKEELQDKTVLKVDIQQQDLNNNGFKSIGILVQNVPGGKYTDSSTYFNLFFILDIYHASFIEQCYFFLL